jgi:diguanylate cyclase (GGDEF)-like protein
VARRRLWLVVSALLAFAGAAATGLIARYIAFSDAQDSRQSFVDSSLKTALANHNIFTQVKHIKVPDDRASLFILLGGIALSVTFGALVFVLGTGRASARALVAERTEQLRYQSFHDSLTGLPNRALLFKRGHQMLAFASVRNIKIGFLFIDLDNFKDINDTLGHDVGDEILIAVGIRLRNAIRDTDIVGRLGGDEFVVVAEFSQTGSGANSLATRILESLIPTFTVSGCPFELPVSASIGIAEAENLTPEELLRDADIALYRAKTAGKQCAVAFSPAMQAAMDDYRNLKADLHFAIETNQFFLQYQPTFNLSSGRVNGVEALLRWRHPEKGIVTPDRFIPALEATGLIVTVGSWVIEEACRQAVEWRRAGHRVPISVNISARQLERDRIIDDVSGALSRTGIAPEMLTLELTETALLSEAEATVTRLNLLKALGVRLAIDDFGTGYSSFAYLQQFPFDVLKIDQSFVAHISDTTTAIAIIHTFVELGKALGLEIIAEGIETDDQRKLLTAQQIDVGQGFFFARPLTVEAVNDLLNETSLEASLL